MNGRMKRHRRKRGLPPEKIPPVPSGLYLQQVLAWPKGLPLILASLLTSPVIHLS